MECGESGDSHLRQLPRSFPGNCTLFICVSLSLALSLFGVRSGCKFNYILCIYNIMFLYVDARGIIIFFLSFMCILYCCILVG